MSLMPLYPSPLNHNDEYLALDSGGIMQTTSHVAECLPEKLN